MKENIIGDKLLNELLSYLKISANKLANELGFEKNTKIYYIKNGRNNISVEIARMIVSKYPEINFTWLITGEGNMLDKSSNDHKISEARESNILNESFTEYSAKPSGDKYLIELIETQKKMIEKLEKEIEELRKDKSESSSIRK